jgi:S-adenosylmethionine/arginine decarboxylase-like enzyme
MTNAKAKESGISLPFLSLSVVLLSWASFQAGKVTREYIDHAHNVSYSRENLEGLVSRAQGLEAEGLWTISERQIPLSVTSEYDKEADGDEKYEQKDVSLLSFRQLFLDLDGIAAQWIQSDKVLQERMKQIAEEYDSHLIAQGCHQDTSGFITCLGTFEDAGHIAIHAWPQRGVVLFDLLAGDSKVIDNVDAFCDIFHADMPKIFDPFLSMEDPRGPPTWHTRSRASVQYSSDYEAEIGTNGESKFMVRMLRFTRNRCPCLLKLAFWI